MECTVTTDYISASCNRTPASLDWGRNFICYGACNSVILCDPNYKGINYNRKTLCKHSARVNSVQWIHGEYNNGKDELISGSSDKTAIVWELNGEDITKTFVLQGHTAAVTVVDGLYLQNSTIIATASVDSTVKIWIRTNEDFILLQDIVLGKVRCLTLKLFEIPELKCPILALGLDNDKIYLYSGQTVNDKMEFMKSEELIGHEDWIRGLDFTLDANGDILLASSSQDTYIRLWKISKTRTNVNQDSLEEKFVQDERAFEIKSLMSDESIKFSVILESVLSGHENWVYGVHWNNINGEIRLLSSSMDKTMIIWKFDNDSEIWLEQVRVGEVGGNSLGFFGGKFSPNGENIMGHGYQGSFHLWVCNKNKQSWIPTVTIGGHYNEIVDLSWEPNGQYLLTASLDQTTRLHAKWNTLNTYHELSRPQVHGYDMSCVANLTRYNFISGGEEKVIRSFQATHNFVENFRRLTLQDKNDSEGDLILKLAVKGASVPSLGLSNKAVYDNEPVKENHGKDIYPENYFVELNLTEPPSEDNLMQNTLWPEIQKLYGHGYEIFCLATSYDCKFLASACKANNLEHASIIIWSTETWKIVQKLQSHQLTVTQLEFSPNDKYLLSVSRDRRWSLFERIDDTFCLKSASDKQNGIHTRIIWCCSWSFDSRFFITGSRDGKIVVWGLTENSDTGLVSFESKSTLNDIKDSVTALDVSRGGLLSNGNYLTAIGTESGRIYLYEFDLGNGLWNLLTCLDSDKAHCLTVKRLRFKPGCNDVLASCGSDHVLKIHNLRFVDKKTGDF